ncbi:MAG: sulfite oxidase heme-binding subunit YedZ [Pseudomonadota bacterium]
MKPIFWLKLGAFTASLVPLAQLVVDFYADQLGANPIEAITHSTGDWTLIFLLLSLTATPLRRLSGWQWPMKLRRMLGLYAFFYACLHFTTYVWLDQFFDWRSILADIPERPFITAGFLSFVLLIPLAATSTTGMIRRLGKRWVRLHRLVYASAIGGVLHYLWLVKADLAQPLLYAAILGMLLGFRLLRHWKGAAGARRPQGIANPRAPARPAPPAARASAGVRPGRDGRTGVRE